MSDPNQWGNTTTGAELIRCISGREMLMPTYPLIAKTGDGKFGKTEFGGIWLDPRCISSYKFYQF